MERYTLQERIENINIHYKNGENLATVRKTRTFLGRRKHLVGPQIGGKIRAVGTS